MVGWVIIDNPHILLFDTLLKSAVLVFCRMENTSQQTNSQDVTHYPLASISKFDTARFGTAKFGKVWHSKV